MPQLFERVTIAGVGLIGGSLALAARAAGLIGEVVGYGRSEANLLTAQRRGIIDRYSRDPLDAARDADLLVLAVPVRAMAAVASASAPALRRGAVVSDVGSVKAAVVRDVEAALPPACRSSARIRSPAPRSPVRRRPSPSCFAGSAAF